MCILFIYRDPGARPGSYKIILAANRDETLNRPAAPAHFWQKTPECLGGMDMEPGREGGTWLALSSKGRFGSLLNLTGEKRTSDLPGKGRGFLVNDYITSNESMNGYLNKLHQENQNGQPYNPYNLVLVNFWNADVHFLSSAENSTGPYVCQGDILGFGNSAIDEPFRKVEMGKERFNGIVENATVSTQDTLIENLLELLKWKDRHLPDPHLQRRAPNWYEELSSIFVRIESAPYGTRTHSILLVDGSNRITFVEQTLMPDSTWKYQTFNMLLE